MENALCCKHRIHFTIVVVFFLCTISQMAGQLHCLNFTSQDGLPADNVQCAVEDLDGFMWFGTSNGLCKFDGITFVDFSSIGSGSIPGGRFVKSIEVDRKKNIWIGTESQGIYHLNIERLHWDHFGTDEEGYHQMKGDEVFIIHAGPDNLIWYGSKNGGLGCIDPVRKVHHNYSIEDLPRRNTWGNRLYDIIVDENDPAVLHMVGQGYIYHFDTRTKEFSTPEIVRQPKVPVRHVFDPQTILQVDDDLFWIGSWNAGVKSFQSKTGSYQDVYPTQEKNSLSWRANVFAGSAQEIWITHRLEGIARFHMGTGKMDFFQPEPFNRNGLLKGEYNAVFHSSQDQTWVLTTKGISVIIPEYQAFSYFETEVERTNFLLDIDEISGTESYIASFAGEHGPLKILDREMNVTSTAFFRKPKDDFQSIFKTVAFEDRFLCMSDNLYEYNPGAKELLPKRIPGFEQKGGLNDILISKERHIWLLVGNGSLVEYVPPIGQVNEYFMPGYRQTKHETVIYQGMAFVGGQIWIATQAELVVFDPEQEMFRYFYFDKSNLIERSEKDPIAEVGGTVHQVVPIDDQCAWIVTSSEGLYKICTSEKDDLSIKMVRNQSSLEQLQSPVEMIRGIENDFWIATKNGLVHADEQLNNFQVFNQREGLKNSKLSQGITRLGDQLFIGMPKGFAKVDTRILLKEPGQARVQIFHANIGAIEILENEVPRFSNDENNFIVSIAAPIYHEAQSVIFAHRLVNHMDDWRLSSASEKVFRYEKLPPGNYTFEVKAKSPGLTWSSVHSRSFIIRPPFWKTTWFRILGFLVLAGTAYLIYQLKLKNDLNKERIKTQLAELESQALRAQMNPHFIFNSLNSIKSLILLDRKEEGITYLTKFSRMVREILSLSKEKAIPLQKELELLGIYLDMESLRFHRKFEYRINIDSSVNQYQLMVPPLLIQPFAENSIWHGLLHKEGDAHLDISLFQEAGFLHIVIVDDGIGREAAARIKSNKSMYRKSSEGLKLSKNRVDLISDFARVDIEDLKCSGKANGTRVTIKLPTNYGKKD